MKDSASVAGSFIYWVLFLPIECTSHRVQPVLMVRWSLNKK